VRRLKAKRYIEDGFDLDEYKRAASDLRYRKKYERNKKTINAISALIVAFSLVLAFLFFQLINYYVNLYKNGRTAEESRQSAGNIYAEEVNAPLFVTGFETADNSGDSEVKEAFESETPEREVKEILPQIANLRATFSNDDIVGYLKIDDTNISYGVAQSDDNDFYLKRDLYGVKNEAGSIFMDYENSVYPLSRNTVIYGHNMRNGSMFHNIRYYADYDFFISHKYVDFASAYESGRWEIFSFYDTTIDFNYINSDFTDEEFQNFIDEIKARSAHYSDVKVTTEDKILTLSTCTNASEDTRFVIHAKRIS
jgi:sortase B